MKRIAYKLLALITLFIATTLYAAAQSNETRQVSGFNKIVSGEALNVHVKIGGTESLKISGKGDISKFIETVVVDGTLTIKFKDNLGDGEGNSDGPLDIYVTAKSLCSITKLGSGYLDVDGALTGKDVSIVLNGSGIVTASVKSVNLNVNISVSGRVNLSGTTDKTTLIIDGPGRIEGQDLKTQDALVSINGAGSAYFHADKTVSASIIGAGGVTYSGSAVLTDSNSVSSVTVVNAK